MISCIWFVAAGGGFLRDIDRVQKVLFFSNKFVHKVLFKFFRIDLKAGNWLQWERKMYSNDSHHIIARVNFTILVKWTLKWTIKFQPQQAPLSVRMAENLREAFKISFYQSAPKTHWKNKIWHEYLEKILSSRKPTTKYPKHPGQRVKRSPLSFHYASKKSKMARRMNLTLWHVLSEAFNVILMIKILW